MTTIAYKDNVIAYESRLTANEIIVDNDYDKKIICDFGILFLSGATSDYSDFIKVLHGEKIAKDDLNNGAILFDKKELFKCGFSNGELWKCPIAFDKCTAIGSGSEFALAAMDCGKSAIEAVQIAIGRDTNSGGKIRTFLIPKMRK